VQFPCLLKIQVGLAALNRSEESEEYGVSAVVLTVRLTQKRGSETENSAPSIFL
jgi:hypothetical protein